MRDRSLLSVVDACDPEVKKSILRWFIHRFPVKGQEPSPEEVRILSRIGQLHLLDTVQLEMVKRTVASVGQRNDPYQVRPETGQ